ncbi:uncharacterized protein EI90DRAFT_2021268 [Cantharellus anzutake]|uniref:uncharacterized protein n=1 Tax=Cantharellus anzutake TaxID=1750568 RepID=UPI001905D122|nr:uncharacterized protein EI90DRAFT_2021268 [Cantharellus anzutake]KAF8325828.1 hypothetical protein EI90DRAFT_2021268 [Cantharellus anzutake]
MIGPLSGEETAILERLVNIRHRLTVLKGNRGGFIKANDVMEVYNDTVSEVNRLNELRDQAQFDPKNNRVDQHYLTYFTSYHSSSSQWVKEGKHQQRIVNYKQLLMHMSESLVYSETDLIPFQRRVEELSAIIHKDGIEEKHPEGIQILLERKLDRCTKLLNTLHESLSDLSPELVPIHQTLVRIRRQLVALAAKPKPPKADLKPLQEELRRIDAGRVGDRFMIPHEDGTVDVPESQAICSSILEECFEIAEEIKIRSNEAEVSHALKPIYDRLWETRAHLEGLLLTHRWTLRETDLWNYARGLQEIDKMRVDGKFVDSDGHRPEGQYVLLYLLRRCYGIIYTLLSSSEPVSEELIPIANNLTTIKKCLNEVLKYGGPFSPHELYPYQLSLHKIESLRVDGTFRAPDGTIPEGQAVIMAH